ncbi:NADH dehydrogenase, FAD-containing subunit [Bacteroidales bacterium 6E]|nr:NADH dehydrogenase, FAD-containing subunit [Bacteroidales bacterium 6E]
MNIPDPQNDQTRIVILGAGFGGLKLARKLAGHPLFQIVLIDRHNFHQFQPLLYQVATAGLEPSSISFPIRKVFQDMPDVFFRIAEVTRIDPDSREVVTNIGTVTYDRLVIAAGARTNFYGNDQLAKHCIGLKSVSEALFLRNRILENFEKSLVSPDEDFRKAALSMVIVGGGPTGVELAGALAEMRNNILPREYPEIDFTQMEISLVEASTRLLGTMTSGSSEKAYRYLQNLGVRIVLNTLVKSYDGQTLVTENENIPSLCVVWAAGIRARSFEGLPPEIYQSNGQIMTDAYNRVNLLENVYAIGDIAAFRDTRYPRGLPQVAPVAIQQARTLATNLLRESRQQKLVPFRYRDKGAMATIGRNLAVVELPFIRFGGVFAWMTWMFVHLMSIVGIKNRFFVFINWVNSYFTYNLSLRLIIKPRYPDQDKTK